MKNLIRWTVVIALAFTMGYFLAAGAHSLWQRANQPEPRMIFIGDMGGTIIVPEANESN